MRLYLLPALLGLVSVLIAEVHLVSAQASSGCQACKGYIANAKACIEGCPAECFQDDDGDIEDDPDDIIECCEDAGALNATCIQTLDEVDDCFDDCLDDCVAETAAEYGVCVALNNGQGGCDKDACDAIKAEKEAAGGIAGENEGQIQADIDEAQSQIDQAEGTIEDLEGDIDDLEDQQDELQDEIDEIEDENEDLEDEIDDIEDEIQDNIEEEQQDEWEDNKDDWEDEQDDKDDKDDNDRPDNGGGGGGGGGEGGPPFRKRMLKGANNPAKVLEGTQTTSANPDGRKLQQDLEDQIDDIEDEQNENQEEIYDLEDQQGNLENEIDDKEDEIDDVEENLDAYFLGKCDNLQPKIDEICELGVGCCPQCKDELEDIMDCMFNDVIRPLIEDELDYEVSEDCEVECSRRRKRFLRQYLGGGGRRNRRNRRSLSGEIPVPPAADPIAEPAVPAEAEAEDPALQACKDAFTFQLSIGNYNDGMNAYLDCVTEATTSDLEPAAGGQEDSADPNYGVNEDSAEEP